MALILACLGGEREDDLFSGRRLFHGSAGYARVYHGSLLFDPLGTKLAASSRNVVNGTTITKLFGSALPT
jgi:hypothetical protein